MAKIIVATHGTLALGFRDNVQTVTGETSLETLTLAQGDNSDDFERTFVEKLEHFQAEGSLVFVDFVGGTPYNLAMKHLHDGLNYKVISGLNAMMLLEAIDKQHELSLEELYRLALEVGKAQILGSDDTGDFHTHPSSSQSSHEDLRFSDGKVTLARVDHRLMHGQVVTKWLKRADASTILIVDDEMSKDSYMVDIYQQAAPNGVEVFVVPTKVVAYAYQHNTLPKGNILLLFRNVEAVHAATAQGLKLENLQLGGIPNDNGNRQMVFTAVCLSKYDVQLLKDIASQGTAISLQVVPEEKGISFAEALKKLHD